MTGFLLLAVVWLLSGLICLCLWVLAAETIKGGNR